METNLTRMRHIVAVADTRSFSLAASEEGITQPALSRSIQAFERDHGVRLFDRGRRGVSLTPAGALVVRQARAMLVAARELDRSLRLYGKAEAGRVELGMGPLMASILLPPLAASMLRARPHLQIMAITRSPELMLEHLLSDAIDMIVGSASQMAQHPGVELEPIGSLQLAPVVRSGHPLAGARHVSASDLTDYPVAGAIDMQIRDTAPTIGAFVCENFHILRDVVEHSDCVWITAPAFLGRELTGGRFRLLRLADQEPVSTEICIARRRGRTRSPAALAVAAEFPKLLGSMMQR